MSSIHPLLAELYQLDDFSKVASYDDDDFDLSDLSDEEIDYLVDALDEDDQADTLEKMAADGSLEWADMLGRIQAHALVDEMDKLAGANYDDDYDIDLNEISAADFLLLEEEMEKGASLRGAARQLYHMTPRSGSRRARLALGRAANKAGNTSAADVVRGGKAAAQRAKIKAILAERGMSGKLGHGITQRSGYLKGKRRNAVEAAIAAKGGFTRPGKAIRRELNRMSGKGEVAANQFERKVGRGVAGAGAGALAGGGGLAALLAKRNMD